MILIIPYFPLDKLDPKQEKCLHLDFVVHDTTTVKLFYSILFMVVSEGSVTELVPH